MKAQEMNIEKSAVFFNKLESSTLDEFCAFMESLTPDKIAKAELHCRRNGMMLKATAALGAGRANCGDEYYDY